LRVQVQVDDSRIFSMSCGSGDSRNVLDNCERSLIAREHAAIVEAMSHRLSQSLLTSARPRRETSRRKQDQQTIRHEMGPHHVQALSGQSHVLPAPVETAPPETLANVVRLSTSFFGFSFFMYTPPWRKRKQE